MRLTSRTIELLCFSAITFTLVALLGCGNGGSSADNEPTEDYAAITFQVEINPPPDHAQTLPAKQAVSEPDICNDYLIDRIGVQVYRAQDDSEVASAEVKCAEHSLTVHRVPGEETLYLVCSGYVGDNPAWQGRVDGIVAAAGQNTDLGIIDMNYTGDNVAAPEVVSTFPASNAAGVDLNTSIAVMFNEMLAPSSISDQAIAVLQGDSPVSGQVDYDPGAHCIRFLPANPLEAETTYTATLQSQSDDSGAITDTARNPFSGDVRWQFTTRGAVDDAAPQVIATSPPDSATDVALQAVISAVFSEPMDPDSLTNGAFQLTSNQGAVSGQIAYDDQTRTLSMTPDSALNAGTLYTAVISTQAGDLALNPLSESYIWEFRSAGDATTPGLVNLTVSAGVEPKTLHFSWDADQDNAVDHYQIEVDPDGASGFSAMAGATGITTTDCTVAIAVHLTDWFNARFRVVALDAAGNQLAASDETGLLSHVTSEEVIGYFKASNIGEGDHFGNSVSLSADGNTLAVGAYSEDSDGIDGDQTNNNAENAGAVYLFARNAGGTWDQQAYVKASNAENQDSFGFSVALSADGNTLAVGAHNEDSRATGIGGDQANNDASDSGAVYLFTRNTAGAWSQQAYIKASNADVHLNNESDGGYAAFGQSVSLSADGNTLAVGAYREDSNAQGINQDQSNIDASDSGAVYLFTRNTAGAWSQQAYVKASDSRPGLNFGYTVSLSADGNTLAVGVRDDAAVYLFARDAANIWSEQVYFRWSTTAYWMDFFGTSVSLSADGNTLAVGTFNDWMVYLFTRNAANEWIQQAYVKASNTHRGDSFGTSVCLSADGNTLAVGAYGERSAATGIGGDQEVREDNYAVNSGAVYLFTRNATNEWRQKAYVKASNTGDGDYFGSSVTLSAEGNTLAVGAYGEASADGNLNNNSAGSAGAVYLY